MKNELSFIEKRKRLSIRYREIYVVEKHTVRKGFLKFFETSLHLFYYV